MNRRTVPKQPLNWPTAARQKFHFTFNKLYFTELKIKNYVSCIIINNFKLLIQRRIIPFFTISKIIDIKIIKEMFPRKISTAIQSQYKI